MNLRIVGSNHLVKKTAATLQALGVAVKVYPCRSNDTKSRLYVNIDDRQADEALSRLQKTIVSDEVFDRFLAACDEAKQPNQALHEAATLTRDKAPTNP